MAGVGVYADLLIDRAVLKADDLAVGEFAVDVDRFHSIVVGACMQLRIDGLIAAAAGGVYLSEGLELSAVGGLFYFISIYIMLIRDVPIQISPSVTNGSGEGSEGDWEGGAVYYYCAVISDSPVV